MVAAQALPGSDDTHIVIIYLLASLLVALIAALPAMLALMVKANRNAKEANDAVNHRHLRTDDAGNEPLKLYDAVLDLTSVVHELRDAAQQNLKDHEYILAKLHRLEKPEREWY